MRLFTTLFSLVLFMQLAWGQSNFSKAETKYQMQAYASALKSYQACHKEEPDNILCMSGIARCYSQMNDYLHAAKWYERLIDRPDVQPEMIYDYAQTLKSLKLYGKAKYYFERYAVFDKEKGEYLAASCDFAMNQVQAKPPFEITNAYFNTGAHDFGLAKWEDKLVFTSFRKDIPKTRRTAEKVAANSVSSDLYLIDPGKEADVRLLFDDIADHSRIGPVHISSDGKYVALTKNQISEESKFFRPEDNRMSIYLAEINENGKWENVTPYPFNDNAYSTAFPWLSEDGMVMFFASNMPGGFGGYDLYVSYKDNGQWTKPQNLGAVINTTGNEIAPFKSEDHLYFSSDMHFGLGGQDVFRTQYADGQWAPVTHLGNGVNSPKDDIGFVYSENEKTGYFYSDRLAGRGKMDIYKATANLREVLITVYDRDLKQTVPDALIKFKETGFQMQTDQHGLAAALVSRETQEDVEVSAEGYYPLSMKLKRISNEGNTMHYEIYMDARDVQAMDREQDLMPAPVSTVQETAEVIKPEALTEEPEGTDEPEELNPPMKKVYVKQLPVVKYAIQVSAFAKGEFVPDRYQDLQSLGKVYDHAENKMTKVRVGYFDSRSEASRVISEVRAAGYEDAFVVEQMVLPGNAESPVRGVTPEYPDFKVRLATYAKPGHFDASKVEKMGKLESYKKNDLTIMLLAGYRTLVEAREALEQAQLAGFPDAYIVKDMGGVLRMIQD